MKTHQSLDVSHESEDTRIDLDLTALRLDSIKERCFDLNAKVSILTYSQWQCEDAADIMLVLDC